MTSIWQDVFPGFFSLQTLSFNRVWLFVMDPSATNMSTVEGRSTSAGSLPLEMGMLWRLVFQLCRPGDPWNKTREVRMHRRSHRWGYATFMYYVQYILRYQNHTTSISKHDTRNYGDYLHVTITSSNFLRIGVNSYVTHDEPRALRNSFDGFHGIFSRKKIFVGW